MNETYQSENVNFDSKIRFASFMNRHNTECQRIKSGYTLQNSPLPPVQAFCNANMYEAVLYNKVVLCYVEGDEAAKQLYLKLGFYHTSEVDENEIEMEKCFNKLKFAGGGIF